jgi:hypothetical protein
LGTENFFKRQKLTLIELFQRQKRELVDCVTSFPTLVSPCFTGTKVDKKGFAGSLPRNILRPKATNYFTESIFVAFHVGRQRKREEKFPN